MEYKLLRCLYSVFILESASDAKLIPALIECSLKAISPAESKNSVISFLLASSILSALFLADFSFKSPTASLTDSIFLPIDCIAPIPLVATMPIFLDTDCRHLSNLRSLFFDDSGNPSLSAKLSKSILFSKSRAPSFIDSIRSCEPGLSCCLLASFITSVRPVLICSLRSIMS